MRRSASLRSSISSILPVPLNSSKITSSMRLPVSIKAVARMVRLPPSSTLRAAPKNRFGRCSALGSTPPDNNLPLGGITKLYARARRVILSSSTTTSFLCSTMRFARSSVVSATRTWFSGGSSNVELMTSAFTERSMSVTSSGRSSISRIRISTSGLFSAILLATCLISSVLPAFGGATMSPRCPFPNGATRSIMRIAYASDVVSSFNRSCGYTGVSPSKCKRSGDVSGAMPFTFSTRKSPK